MIQLSIWTINEIIKSVCGFARILFCDFIWTSTVFNLKFSFEFIGFLKYFRIFFCSIVIFDRVLKNIQIPKNGINKDPASCCIKNAQTTLQQKLRLLTNTISLRITRFIASVIGTRRHEWAKILLFEATIFKCSKSWYFCPVKCRNLGFHFLWNDLDPDIPGWWICCLNIVTLYYHSSSRIKSTQIWQYQKDRADESSSYYQGQFRFYGFHYSK